MKHFEKGMMGMYADEERLVKKLGLKKKKIVFPWNMTTLILMNKVIKISLCLQSFPRVTEKFLLLSLCCANLSIYLQLPRPPPPTSQGGVLCTVLVTIPPAGPPSLIEFHSKDKYIT